MSTKLHRLIEELDQTLSLERQSLTQLDRCGIEKATERKLQLVELIQQARSESPVHPESESLLASVQESARTNHLLLVHARACVRGALSLLQREPLAEGPASGRASTSLPLAVSIKG